MSASELECLARSSQLTDDRWNHIRKPERHIYLKNAYRVLLPRPRQGMVIVVPPGDADDPTRKPEFYDPTFDYLREISRIQPRLFYCTRSHRYRRARQVTPIVCTTPQNDKLLSPIRCNVDLLGNVLEKVLSFAAGEAEIDREAWERGRYCPTPTIIEAALALYKGHSVSDISRNDATAINLSLTSDPIHWFLDGKEDVRSSGGA